MQSDIRYLMSMMLFKISKGHILGQSPWAGLPAASLPAPGPEALGSGESETPASSAGCGWLPPDCSPGKPGSPPRPSSSFLHPQWRSHWVARFQRKSAFSQAAWSGCPPPLCQVPRVSVRQRDPGKRPLEPLWTGGCQSTGTGQLNHSWSQNFAGTLCVPTPSPPPPQLHHCQGWRWCACFLYCPSPHPLRSPPLPPLNPPLRWSPLLVGAFV